MPGPGTKTVDKTVYNARLQINTDKKHVYASCFQDKFKFFSDMAIFSRVIPGFFFFFFEQKKLKRRIGSVEVWPNQSTLPKDARR